MRIVDVLAAPAALPGVGFWTSGIASLDEVLAGGMGYGQVHEIYAGEAQDVSSAAGFALGLAMGMCAGHGKAKQAMLWLRERRSIESAGILHASGWAELGGAPEHGLVGVVPDTVSLLRATAEALHCGELGAVTLEGWGTMRALDLTASRRLVLAAEKSGVPLLLLRINARPSPSAARTRWQVVSAPSRALPGNAPGRPTFDLTLLRQRSGPCGLGWRLEWDRDRRKFREAPLSGAMVSVPLDRPLADRENTPERTDAEQAGAEQANRRHAA